MNELELSSIDDTKYTRIITPVKREKKVHKDPLIIGFTIQSNGDSLAIIFYSNGESRTYIYHQMETCNDSSCKYRVDIFVDYILQLLSELDINPCSNCIHLVTHDVRTKLSYFDIPSHLKLIPTYKGLHIEGKVRSRSFEREVTLNVIDLYSLTTKKLKELAKYIETNPITQNQLDNKIEGYCDENTKLILKRFPSTCDNLSEARIAYEAYIKLRSYFIANHNIDLINFKSIPSLTGYLFRRDYIDDSIVSYKVVKQARKQAKKLSDGNTKYYDVIQRAYIFDGDYNIRRYSMLAYHGGRIETFCRGRFEDNSLIYYDVDSLYPSSSILQPLPLADTKWIKFNGKNAEKFINSAEGFVEVEFIYSPDTFYPCLPVPGVRDTILYFPLTGTTYCTISELRMAIKLGLNDYKILSGYGFYPTNKERNHPLANLMKDMLEKKQLSKKGSIEYEMYKMQMNSLVGKLVQRDRRNTVRTILDEDNIPSNVKPKINNFSKSSVGSLWYPEWASLILGKARALMSEFISKGSYFVSTDSVLLPADIDINCDSLTKLRSVGSDLRKEFDVDHGVIVRARLYALNPLNDNPNEKRLARHAVSCEPDEFSKMMKVGYNTRTVPNLITNSKKQIQTEKSIHQINDPNSINANSWEIKWDGKRRLFNDVDNPFNDFSWSEPLNETEIENNELRRPKKDKPGRKRGKKIDTEKKRNIARLHEMGTKQIDIANELSVSEGYVSKVCQDLRKTEEKIIDG